VACPSSMQIRSHVTSSSQVWDNLETHQSLLISISGKPAYSKIVESFGREVLLDGDTSALPALDRKKLGRIVFADADGPPPSPPSLKRLPLFPSFFSLVFFCSLVSLILLSARKRLNQITRSAIVWEMFTHVMRHFLSGSQVQPPQ
jgi:hypothetical protein